MRRQSQAKKLADAQDDQAEGVDFPRLALVRDAVIEPIKTLILRKSELDSLCISVVSSLLLTLPGRYAIDSAARGKFRVAQMSTDAAKRLRNITPNIDTILRDQKRQDRLWNLFFVAAWSEFEAAVDDIRLVALRAGKGMAEQLNVSTFLTENDEKLLRKFRELLVTAPDVTRFEQDLCSYTLLGFSHLPRELTAQLEAANQVRNVLVHRRGIVDNRALTKAPSLIKFGDRVSLNNEDYVALLNAIFGWATHLLGDLVALDKQSSTTK